MNAYELAKELNACFTKADWEYVDDAANMLRQQADRIAELEKELETLKIWTGTIQPIKTNAEPVAWGMRYKDGTIYDCICAEEHSREEGKYTIPLYTTPQSNPLSDKEIEQIYYKDFNYEDADMVKFARAIEERHGIK